MDYFQCDILLVVSLFKPVLSPAQHCLFFTCTYTFQFRVNWNQLDNPIFFFPIVVIFLYMGISRVLMSAHTCVAPQTWISAAQMDHILSLSPFSVVQMQSGSCHFIRSLFFPQAGFQCHFGQYKPMGQPAVLLGFSLSCNVLVFCFFYKDRRGLIFVFSKMGWKVIFFSFFLLLCYTPGLWMFLWKKHCTNGAELSDLRQAPHVYHRSPSSCSVPGVHLPLWSGESVTYVTGPSRVFMRQRFLRCLAWLYCFTLNCSPNPLWVLAFLSSSGLFPAVLVYWPKFFLVCKVMRTKINTKKACFH